MDNYFIEKGIFLLLPILQLNTLMSNYFVEKWTNALVNFISKLITSGLNTLFGENGENNDEDKYLEISIKAHEYYNSGNYKKALNISKKLINDYNINIKSVLITIYELMEACLGRLADKEDDIDKKKNLYNDAIEICKKIIEINLNSDSVRYAYRCWDGRLFNLANIEDDIDKKKNLYNDAIEKLKKIIGINFNNNEDVYYDWGLNLEILAEIEDDEDKKKNLDKSAIEKYKKIIGINPNHKDSYNCWGNCLRDLADIEDDIDEKKSLYNDAIEKYKKVIEIDPNHKDSYNCWGNTLIDVAKLEQGNERDNLLNEAETILLKSVKLGGGFYNLSCVYAIKGERDKAFEYLKKALENKDVYFDHVEKDTDIDSLRNDKRYIKLKNKYRS